MMKMEIEASQETLDWIVPRLKRLTVILHDFTEKGIARGGEYAKYAMEMRNDVSALWNATNMLDKAKPRRSLLKQDRTEEILAGLIRKSAEETEPGK